MLISIPNEFKLIEELFGINIFLFVRSLKRQSREINLNILKELKRKKLRKILVVGPAISPYFYQLVDKIDAYFVALDINRNCLELTSSLIDLRKVSDVVKMSYKKNAWRSNFQ